MTATRLLQQPMGRQAGEQVHLTDLHDAAVRWRSSPDGGPREGINVILFDRSRRDTGAKRAPEVAINAAARPAAALAQTRRLPRMAALLALSVAAHVGLYLPFQRDPAPMSSIGLESISVDIVLGAQEDAGLIKDRGTAEASAPTPSQAPDAVAEPRPIPETAVEVAALATPPAPTPETAKAVEVQEPPATPPPPVEAAPATEVQTAAKPVAPVEPSAAPAQPAAVQAVAEAARTGELAVSANPIEVTAAVVVPPEPPPVPQPTETTEQHATPPHETAKPVVVQRRERPTPPKTERKPERETRQVRIVGERNESRSTAPAAAAAGGVGRGRSDASTNYRGLVAAHLARHKQFPAEARSRGAQGSATVSFGLDGGGRVTSVRLASGTGVPSLDQEATAMVRRASPFPTPPDGRAVTFTVPVSFRLW